MPENFDPCPKILVLPFACACAFSTRVESRCCKVFRKLLGWKDLGMLRVILLAKSSSIFSVANIEMERQRKETLCKKLDIRYRIFCVYFEFTHQESHLRNEPVSHCVYFEYPQPHHVRLEGFTKQCLRIPLCDTLHRIRCWVRTPILFMVY